MSTTTQTLFLHRDADQNGKVEWRPESFRSLKQTMTGLPEGIYQITVKEVKQHRGWRNRFYWGHVLPMIVAYMNKVGINQIVDPATGECIPIDCETLHEYHKYIFNPGLVKNVLRKQDARGNTPEFIVVPMTTTKLTDSEFINRFEEEIIATYANQYNIEFLSRDEFREYFESGKDSRMIVEMQSELNA